MWKQKLILLLIIAFSCGYVGEAMAQRANKNIHRTGTPFRKKNKPENPFFNTQIWLGIKAGSNITKAYPTERHSVFTSTLPEQQNAYDKVYDGFGKPGTQIGIVGTYNFKKNFSISAQPVYTSINFGYKNEFSWAGEGNHSVSLTQQHKFTLHYLELPLLLRYDIIRTRFRPYLQAGAFYGLLTKADKFIALTSLDNASGAVNPIDNNSPVIGAKKLFITSQWGWMGGLGVSYDIGNVRIGVDAVYKRGMNNITNEKNRYSDNRMVGVGDVMDNMTLRNVDFAFTCVFPMKYLIIKNFRGVTP